jgi:hypothetical protein
MDPLRAELTPPHQRRVSAFCEGVEKAAPSGRRWRKEKTALSLKKPAPKINLVEAHLNRPSPQEKGLLLTTDKRS